MTLAELRAAVPVGSIWRHYDGPRFVVVGYAWLEDGDSLVVLHRNVNAPEGSVPWARPAGEWRERADEPLDRMTREE